MELMRFWNDGLETVMVFAASCSEGLADVACRVTPFNLKK
jgi:hypothetical protein